MVAYDATRWLALSKERSEKYVRRAGHKGGGWPGRGLAVAGSCKSMRNGTVRRQYREPLRRTRCRPSRQLEAKGVAVMFVGMATAQRWGMDVERARCHGGQPLSVDERQGVPARALTGTHQSRVRRISLATACQMKLDESDDPTSMALAWLDRAHGC